MLCCAFGAMLLSLLMTWHRARSVLSGFAGGWLASGVVAAIPLLLVAGAVLQLLPATAFAAADGAALCLTDLASL
ncbi:hypothetical protein ACFOW6_15310 [Fodinicurvata halophila]|uniref:Uncharacterized protein n=1 Tax=Fodinicurvata halophila TaxID=1419723 RepID=A0ABV8UP83_9PROT